MHIVQGLRGGGPPHAQRMALRETPSAAIGFLVRRVC